MNLASAAQSLFSPGGGVQEQKTEQESVSSADHEPKDQQLSVLKEVLAIAEENVALIENRTEESQNECNNVASLGESANQAEPAQKHAEMQELTNRQQNAETQQDKLQLRVKLVGHSRPPAQQDPSTNATSAPQTGQTTATTGINARTQLRVSTGNNPICQN